MVKRLLAGTFFLHLHRKSSSYTSCSTTQMIASPGQAANPMEVTLLTAGTAPGHLLTATSAGRELRRGRLHRRLPRPGTSQFSRGAGREALLYCVRLSACFPPAHPRVPSRPQPHTLTWHTCRHSPRPACPTSQTAPAPARCLRLAARAEERSGHKRPVHVTAQLPAEMLSPRDNMEREHRATDPTKSVSLLPARHCPACCEGRLGCTAPNTTEPQQRSRSSCSGTRHSSARQRRQRNNGSCFPLACTMP